MTTDHFPSRSPLRQRRAARSTEGAWVAMERARNAAASGNGPFAQPVEVALGQVVVHLVRSAREALDCLLGTQWPDKSGKDYELAIGDCLKAMAGGDREAARLSFRAAARHAHVLQSDNAHQ